MVETGALVYPIVANSMAPPGWPDRLIVLKGLMLLVEFKGLHTAVRPAQEVVFKQIAQRYPVFIARYPCYLTLHNGEFIGKFKSGVELCELLRGACNELLHNMERL